MAIQKRTPYTVHRVIVRVYRLEGTQQIITSQYVKDMPVRLAGAEAPEALINGRWFSAIAIDPEQRGGCEFEVNKPSVTS